MGTACVSQTSNHKIKESKNVMHPNQLIPFARFVDIKKEYNYVSDIYLGTYSKVTLYHESLTDKDKYIIKSINKTNMTKTQYECLITEIAHLRKFDHPNVVAYFDAFEDDDSLSLVIEYMEGSDLFNHYQSVMKWPEERKCDVVYQILCGLCYFHKAGIYHRDIKLENITFSSDYQDKDTTTFPIIKLIDFGFATCRNDNRSIGSLHYMSPEMINGNGCCKSDIWSLGIVLYGLITGKFPFEAEQQDLLFASIQKDDYNKDHLNGLNCSNEVKDLIDKMLTKNDSLRVSSFDALNHPWFSKYFINTETNTISKEFFTKSTLEIIELFSSFSIVKKYFMMLFVRYINNDDLVKYNKMFYALDPDHYGVINKEYLQNQFKSFNMNTSPLDAIDTIQNDMFEDPEERLTYSLFVAIMITRNFSQYACNETDVHLLFNSCTLPSNMTIITESSFVNCINNIADINVNDSKAHSYFVMKSQLTYEDVIAELGLSFA